MAGKPQPPEKRKTIDLEQFEKLCSYQCTQREIAGFFDMSVDTLERTLKRDHGIILADVWHNRQMAGRVRHRKAAIENIEAGKPGWSSAWIHIDKKLNPSEQYVPPIQGPPDTASMIDVTPVSATPAIKTFTQFCIDAGYFVPFPKQEEMRNFGFDLDCIRLLLGARGYGKTDFVTIMGTAYRQYLAVKMKTPLEDATVLIITKSKPRNGAIVNEIADALEKNGVLLAKRTESVIRVNGIIGQDHSVEAITIKSSMRGRHPKLTIMDDPVTDEDVSEATRNLVKRRYDEVVKLCENVLIIGQPAHAHDLYAQLRDIVETMEVPHGSIPELDADLEALKIAAVDPASIEMSYHLRVPISGTSPFAKIKRIDQMPSKDCVAFIDPSDGGDFTAVSIMTGYMDGIAVVGFAWKMAWYHCIDEIEKVFIKYGVKRFCFETNSTGTQPLDQLRQKFKTIGVVGKHSDTNKHACIMQAGTFAEMIHLCKESSKIYSDQVVQYEYGAKFDDSPDSLARCLEWLGMIRGRPK